jgi:hypothetical protein
MTDEKNNLIISFVVGDMEDKNLALLALNEIKQHEKLDVEVKKYKSKRSVEQNKALWWILGKLATAMSGSKNKVSTEEAYCTMLEEANVAYDYILALPEAEKELKKVFRVVRKIDEREVNGKKLNMYQYFLGSSKYDTKQMYELITNTLLKIDELGVVDSEIEEFRRKYEE